MLATKSALQETSENSNHNGGTIRACMTRDRLAHVVPQSLTCQLRSTLSIEKHSISCAQYLSKTHFVLRLPRNLRMEVHEVLSLPRNLHLEVHKALHLPRVLRMEVQSAAPATQTGARAGGAVRTAIRRLNSSPAEDPSFVESRAATSPPCNRSQSYRKSQSHRHQSKPEPEPSKPEPIGARAIETRATWS